MLGVWVAKGIQKGRFWESFLKTFWGQGRKVRIKLPCRRELDFEGFGGSKKRHFLTQFWEGVPKALWGGMFDRFC